MSDPTLLVLASLADGDKHGYAMMADIQDFAGCRLRLVRVVATLYPRRWRERYGIEFEALLEDQIQNL